MRPCIVILLLLAVATGITGLALGWFTFFTSPNEEITLNVDPEKVPGWFQTSTSAKDEKTDITVMVEKMKKDRAEFQEHAELRFRAMDLGLDELKAKAKHGRAVTKEQMNRAIVDLNEKTEAAREELQELRTAPQERWQGLKTRLSGSLEQLQDGFERAFSRFMTQWTHSVDERALLPGYSKLWLLVTS